MIRAALEEIDLSALLAALADQEAHGHTATTDAELPVYFVSGKLVEFANGARDVTHPGDRRNLELAYRRTARLGAMCIAVMRRIRIEQERASPQ